MIYYLIQTDTKEKLSHHDPTNYKFYLNDVCTLRYDSIIIRSVE